MSGGTFAGFPITKPGVVSDFNILLYGESGSGKTMLAGSASVVPELQPVIFLDVEGGVLTLRDHYPDVDVVRISKWPDITKFYNELRKGGHGYRTVVIDSLGELQKFSMNEIMAQVAKEDETRDPDIPSMREWGKNLEQMRRIVRRFRDLPMHTIFTAHAKLETYGKAERTRTKVSLTGQLGSEAPGFVDMVLYLYVKTVNKQEKRMLLTGQREDVIAKDRTNRLPLVIEEPTMQKVFDLINGDKSVTQVITADDISALVSK